MQTENTSLGKHIDVVGPYSLQISYHIIFELLRHYITVISKTLKREFPSEIHSMVLLYPCCRTKSYT